MKEKMKNYIGVACLALMVSACGDDFLNEAPEGDLITADQLGDGIELNPELGEATVTGIYSTMFVTETGGTTGHDDFGQKAYDVFGDMVSGDMALTLSTFGWYRSSITELQAPLDFTLQDNYQVWRYYYRIINLSNLVIESFGGNDAVPETADNRYTLGQAIALRAHAYFFLTQYMINDIEASWTTPTLPIYTEPGFVGSAKSTTQEVYDLMEADLNKAVNLLDGYARPSKTQIDKPVAQTILAYVLASRRDRWADVATIAGSALANTTATPMTTDDTVNGILGGFNDVASQGWMWGVDLNADIGLGLISWWGQIDAYSFSYAAFGDNKGMDSGLYNSMRADDVRRDQFFNQPANARHLQPLFKFYDSDRVITGASQIVKADYIYMRYEEPLLLQIEGLAKSGQEGLARAALLDFVSTRVTDASFVNTLGGQSLLDEIYKQTRLEFWGEGKSYLALKRNKGTVNRGSNHLSFAGIPIPFDDERLTFEIPQEELQDNNNITTQN